MRRAETWIPVAFLMGLGVYGAWAAIPFFAILGFGFAAARLVSGRREIAVLALTFVGMGVAALVDAAGRAFDAWSGFGLFAGIFLIGSGAFIFWRLRRTPG